MAWGASRSEGSAGENINHFTAVRMRLQGIGNLKMSLISLDDIRSVTLGPFPMALLTNIQPTRLTNFMEQRAVFRLETTEINEYFKINRIVIFVKETYSSYPG